MGDLEPEPNDPEPSTCECRRLELNRFISSWTTPANGLWLTLICLLDLGSWGMDGQLEESCRMTTLFRRSSFDTREVLREVCLMCCKWGLVREESRISYQLKSRQIAEIKNQYISKQTHASAVTTPHKSSSQAFCVLLRLEFRNNCADFSSSSSFDLTFSINSFYCLK